MYIQDKVQRGEARENTRLKKVVVRHQEQTIREKRFSYREDNLKSPPLVLLQGRASLKEKQQTEDERSVLSRGKKCGTKHDPEKRRDSK